MSSTDSTPTPNPIAPQPEEILQLPQSSSTSSTAVPSLKLGDTLQFADLGPIIISSDGTTKRISNWDSMTKGEQDVTWRRIAKRNEERLVVLREEAAAAAAIDTANSNNDENGKEL